MKKGFIFFLAVLIFLGFWQGASAQEQVEVNFFYSQTCPHCAKEKLFLEQVEKDYPEVKINKLLVSENIGLLQEFYKNYNVLKGELGLVPITFIEDKYFLGFDEKTQEKIENCIVNKVENGPESPCDEESINGFSDKVSLPIIGEINPQKYSLATLSVMFGFFDGFNVCSLGALILILGLVLSLKERKKIFFYGGVFVLTTAIIYGFLIFLWHQIFSLFAGYLRVMEIMIGILGIGGGVYFLKEFIRFKKYGPTCDIGTGTKITNKFFPKLQKMFESSSGPILIVPGILLFAGIITIVEFPCSAAVPLVFAGILAKSQLSFWSYLFYITLFVVFYMLDEIVVFLIAFFTMNIKIASPKVVVWITLVESIVLFLLGFYYLFGIAVLIL